MSNQISIFNVFCLINGGNAGLISNALYANGKHQLKIEVDITKQVNGVNTPLSDSEKKSIQLVEYGQEHLPSSWSSTTTNNGYTEGLRTSSLMQSNGLSAIILDDISEFETKTIYPEIFNFYLSSSDVTVEPKRLVAKITLDDSQVFTSGDTSFNKIMDITPTAPYRINSIDLIKNSDEHVYNNPLGKYDEYNVVIQSWSMPFGLTFKSYIINASRYSGGNYAIWFSPSGKDPLRALMALPHDTTSFKAVSFMACATQPWDDNTVIVPDANNRIRASRAQLDGFFYSTSPGHSNCTLTIVDNYGCQSIFELYSTDSNGTLVDIRNA